MRRRGIRGFALLAVAALGAHRATAIGTIDTSGATIETGASSTPGTVTIDPAAAGTAPDLPGVDPPGLPPQMTDTLPQQPSYGNGGLGALSTSGAVVLLPGTYEYASVEILPGGSITCGGATTILVTGNVDLYGPVSSTTASSPIEFRCGGNFQIHSANPANTFTTTGSLSAITITAGGALAVGTGQVGQSAILSATTGDVRLVSLGTQGGARGLVLAGGEARAPGGRTTLISAAELDIGSSGSQVGIVEAGAGPAVLQSFSQRLFVLDAGTVRAPAGSEIRLESAGIFDCQGTVLSMDGSNVTIRAVSGPLGITGSVVTTNGQLLLESGGDINVFSQGASLTGSTTGGDVALRAQGTITVGGKLSSGNSNGEITVIGKTGVRLQNNAVIDSQADVDLHAVNGDVVAQYDAQVKTTRTLRVRADDDLILAEAPGGKTTQGSTAVIRGSTVELSCGGHALLDAAEMRATGSSLTLLAAGDIGVARLVRAADDILLTSQSGDIDASGASIITDSPAVVGSGRVVVETYRSFGEIDASGSTIRTGDSSTQSGDISLLVHDLGGASPGAVVSYVLPKKVVVKVVPGKPERTSLAASGFFDTGPDPLDFTQAAVISVGSKDFSVAGLTRKGGRFEHSEPGLAVRIVPAKNGSSRAKFRLNAKGAALDGAFALGTEVPIEFDFDDVDGFGRVRLTGSSYVFGAKAGALVAPNVFPVKAVAKLGGEGRDSLQLIAGLATNGMIPGAAPDVTVSFGETFSAEIASGAFTRKGSKYTSSGNPRVILDYAKERLAVVATGTSLGTFSDGAQPLTVRVGLGAEVREVQVRVVRKGKKLSY